MSTESKKESKCAKIEHAKPTSVNSQVVDALKTLCSATKDTLTFCESFSNPVGRPKYQVARKKIEDTEVMLNDINQSTDQSSNGG